MLFSSLPLMASTIPYFEEKAPAPTSLANHIHLLRSTDSMDSNWLPVLIGLPDYHQVSSLTQHTINVMMEEKDIRCTSISFNLRMMIFQHFVIYQQMVNAQNVYFDDQIAHQWAHVLAMILKESSGDTSNITDMGGYSISTDDSKSNLQEWRQILKLSSRSRVELNYQTNFGLVQTSADRLLDAFHLTKEQKEDIAFLDREEGASMPNKLVLNTAVAIRRLVLFYQGFAKGRILDSQTPFNKEDISNPYPEEYKKALNMALIYCGTRLMFQADENSASSLQNAMASIAFCNLGNQKPGYDLSKMDLQCFAQWVTLCPALNIDIATLTPLNYFATKGQQPVCEETFKRLIIKEPGSIITPLR